MKVFGKNCGAEEERKRKKARKKERNFALYIFDKLEKRQRLSAGDPVSYNQVNCAITEHVRQGRAHDELRYASREMSARELGVAAAASCEGEETANKARTRTAGTFGRREKEANRSESRIASRAPAGPPNCRSAWHRWLIPRRGSGR